jgi:DNA-binding Lrp family transcriptional regulator
MCSDRRLTCGSVQVLIPPGSVSLAGDEHIKARQFLDAVGLTDEDAAPVHIDVGRSLFRQNVENSARDEQVEGVKSFQKLVYLSSQLFGDLKSGYLTPWVSRFSVTPEQVAVAKRNGARMILQGRINSELAGDIPADVAALQTLREIQIGVGLSDEACGDLVREMLAAGTEQQIKSALDDMKTRGSRPTVHDRAVSIVDALISRSRSFVDLAAAASVQGSQLLVPGIGALTVIGTKFAHGTTNDLVDLYRFYMVAKMEAADNTLSEELSRNLDDLTAILNLPANRLEYTRATIINDAYSKLLKDAVTSGQLDAAESPASLLNDLITRVSMPGEQALSMHESLYQAKLRDCLADKCIDDSDAQQLARTARLLCLTSDLVMKNDQLLKGDIMREAVRKALDIGISTFGAEDAEAVAEMKDALRLTEEQAMAVLKDVGRGRLVGMVNAARNKGVPLLA